MSARCNHVFRVPIGANCKCGADLSHEGNYAHRIERDNATGGIDVTLECSQCCPRHGMGDTTPLPDRDTIETIAGKQERMF